MNDYIEREDAVKVIAEQAMYDSDMEYSSGTTDEDLEGWKDWARDLLIDIPSADVVERKRGEWIKTDRTYCGATVYECSACCYEVDEMPTVMGKPRYNYCPSCGAYMRAEQTEPQTERSSE